MTICVLVSLELNFKKKGKEKTGKHTQSPSFWTVGTPISSKVLGPLPGRPDFWLAEAAGGLGVDGVEPF